LKKKEKSEEFVISTSNHHQLAKCLFTYDKYQVHMFYNKSLSFEHSVQPKSGDLWDDNIHKLDKKGQFFTQNTNFSDI